MSNSEPQTGFAILHRKRWGCSTGSSAVRWPSETTAGGTVLRTEFGRDGPRSSTETLSASRAGGVENKLFTARKPDNPGLNPGTLASDSRGSSGGTARELAFDQDGQRVAAEQQGTAGDSGSLNRKRRLRLELPADFAVRRFERGDGDLSAVGV